MERKSILDSIETTLRKEGIRKAYLFGSFARGEKKYRDIDIAIEAPKDGFSLLDLIGIEQALEAKLHKKIDLMTLRSISPHFLPYIKKDLVLLYES